MNLENAVGIVTGSSSGVGAATARLLAGKGCHVVINYSRSEEAAHKVAGECTSMGVDVLCCKADVSNDDDCRRMVSEAIDKWGRINVLVNNAGTTKFVPHARLDGLNKADFFHIYGVNVVGPYQMTRAAEAALRKTGNAAIVNVDSVAGVYGVGSSIAYAASKGALLTMTKSLARVLGPEIRVNAVCPGFIQGEWLEQGLGSETYRRAKENLETRTPLKLTCSPATVAESVLQFIEGHSTVTGQYIILDGGNHLL